MSLLRFVILVLGVWRITHLLHAEDGPWDVLLRLRRALGGGPLGGALRCFYCSSLWVALPLAYVGETTLASRALLWPALSAGAILLERLTDRPRPAVPAPYFEDPPSEPPRERSP
jgi:hypothetical protein